jgi:hypothetical protein
MVQNLEPSLENDDGTFWMSWEDFNKYFCAITVLKMNSPYMIRESLNFRRNQD